MKQGEEEADDENEEESEDERDKSDPDDRCEPVHFSEVCCRKYLNCLDLQLKSFSVQSLAIINKYYGLL